MFHHTDPNHWIATIPVLYSYALNSLSLGAGILHGEDCPAAVSAIVDGDHSAGFVYYVAVADKVAAMAIPFTENLYLITGGKHFPKALAVAFLSTGIRDCCLQGQGMALLFQLRDNVSKEQVSPRRSRFSAL